MGKEYFSHDYHTRNKKKLAVLIHEEKMKGYGLFWIIVEMLHEDSEKWLELDESTFIAISKESGCTISYVSDFIEKSIKKYEVFIAADNRFTTERVLQNIGKREEIAKVRSEAGKRSAELRKNSTHVQQTSTNAEQVSTNIQQNATKESKGKESKLNNRAKALVVSGETTHDCQKEYEIIRAQFSTTDPAKVWESIKAFLIENKPHFILPYVDLWNVLADRIHLSQVQQITESRKKKFTARIREEPFDFIAILQGIRKSPMLKGETSDWRVTFDWIIENDKNYLKIIEGQYN